MRRVSILLALLGLALAAALLLRFDAGDVWRVTRSVGWHGAAILLAWQALIALILGMAWATIQPRVPPTTLIWGRMVRDAATVCLPFSPVGGYVIGARAVTLRGPAWTEAAAGTVVDVSAELTAQFLFALVGLAILLGPRPGDGYARSLALPIVAALVIAAAGAALAISQRGRLANHVVQPLARLLLGQTAQVDVIRRDVARLYARRARLLLGVALHLTAWFATGLATWISLRLLDHPAGLPGILALEALLDAAVAAAFLVPGAAGVQEAGYVGLGAILGVPPDVALSVSLLRRAREIGWGLPVLGLWQWQELRRI